MPVAVTAAAVGYFAAGAAVSAGWIAAGTLAFAAISGAVSFVVQAALRSAIDSDDGGAGASVTMDNQLVTIRQPTAPWQIIYGRACVGGVYTFVESTSNNVALHQVVTYAGHVCEAIETVYFGDEVVPHDGIGGVTGRFANHVRFVPSLGGEAGQPLAELQVATTRWLDGHRQTGRTKAYYALSWSSDLFPQGVPNFTVVIKGKKVYDPRTGLTVWSANPALCVADYLTDDEFGLGADYASEIDEAALIAAANICDEAVTLAAGGTEPRYTLNGSFKTVSTPKEILGRMLTAMSGKVVFIGGLWRIKAGAYVSPTVTLTADDLRGAIRIIPRLSRRDICNGVKGVYISPENLYQPSDFPVVTNATYLSEDQGERIWRDIDLPFTNSASMSQRIAKIDLEQTRQQIVVQLPCKLTAYTIQPGDTVSLTLARYGWTAKVFEVMSSQLSFEEDAGGIRLGVDHVLRETASAVYAWNSGEETVVDPAPDTDLPNPFAVGVPGDPSIAESLYETTSGVRARAIVTWGASADAFVTEGGSYELEYKASAATVYTRISGITSTMQVLDDLSLGIYNFRVRAVNMIGVRSAYSGVVTKELTGVTAPPTDITNLTVIKSTGFALVQWDLPVDLDVRIGGFVVIRHSPLITGATWGDGIILETFPGSLVQGFAPLITGTYMAKALDASGNYSSNAVFFVATEGMVTGWSTVGTITQHPTFTGTKTNVAIVGSVLQLDGSTLIDDMLDPIDDWPAGDVGGIAAAGRYDFDIYMDLTTVATRRYEADISAASFDTGDTIDVRSAFIDDWDAFDGDVINDCDVTLYAEITDDDPAGTPTWSERHPFFVADFTCRAARFSLDFVSGQSTHNIAVSELIVHAKIPA